MIERVLRAAALGSATMGLLAVLYTGASQATLIVTAWTGVLYVGWLLTPGSGQGGSEGKQRNGAP